MNLKSAKHPWRFFPQKKPILPYLTKLLSTHCWRQNFRSWVHQRGNSLYLHAPVKILKEPKLIMFQVKIIHNILPTQSRLFHSRITDTDVFPLCNLESQSLKHMLITCSVSSSLWTCFPNWWHKKFKQKPTLSESTTLYGWHKESNNWEVLNYCLIVAKYNVFVQAYVTASWTLTVLYCVSITKLIIFAP